MLALDRQVINELVALLGELPEKLYSSNLDDAWDLLKYMPVSAYNHLLPMHARVNKLDLATKISQAFIEYKENN